MKRWQEYTEELYKKGSNDLDKHDGVATHLEPDILECEVKWTLGRFTTNKASRGDGMSPDLFQIRKDDAVKVLCSICQQMWKSHQWPQDWKKSIFIPISKKGNAKECSDYHTIMLISHTKQGNVQNLSSNTLGVHKLPDVQAGFRKGRGTRGQVVNICWIIEKIRGFQKNHVLLLH